MRVVSGCAAGRPLLLDINAIIALDLLPLAHISSSSSGGGGGSAALAATAAAMKGGAAAGSSLFDLLDGTVSAAGRRKLRQWICRWVALLLLPGSLLGAKAVYRCLLELLIYSSKSVLRDVSKLCLSLHTSSWWWWCCCCCSFLQAPDNRLSNQRAP